MLISAGGVAEISKRVSFSVRLNGVKISKRKAVAGETRNLNRIPESMFRLMELNERVNPIMNAAMYIAEPENFSKTFGMLK